MPHGTLKALSTSYVFFEPLARCILYRNLVVSGDPSLDVALPTLQNTHAGTIQPMDNLTPPRRPASTMHLRMRQVLALTISPPGVLDVCRRDVGESGVLDSETSGEPCVDRAVISVRLEGGETYEAAVEGVVSWMRAELEEGSIHARFPRGLQIQHPRFTDATSPSVQRILDMTILEYISQAPFTVTALSTHGSPEVCKSNTPDLPTSLLHLSNTSGDEMVRALTCRIRKCIADAGRRGGIRLSVGWMVPADNEVGVEDGARQRCEEDIGSGKGFEGPVGNIGCRLTTVHHHLKQRLDDRFVPPSILTFFWKAVVYFLCCLQLLTAFTSPTATRKGMNFENVSAVLRELKDNIGDDDEEKDGEATEGGG
ncbi:hypothetical protein B9479_004820 [Cryptococcus floricola]|uniref:Uncharacterized protein n=1 Tax=Cryptococcus floricola TaxID=2591691 RepID=A0A5D3AXC1_9TREE|nr:hypothetical protein B9479_004820 [Cryptococcus floricola]